MKGMSNFQCFCSDWIDSRDALYALYVVTLHSFSNTFIFHITIASQIYTIPGKCYKMG